MSKRTNTATRMRLKALSVVAVLAVGAVLIGCYDASPTGIKQVPRTPRATEIDVDSSPKACQMLDCRSLTSEELDMGEQAAWRGYMNASLAGDYTCADAFNQAFYSLYNDLTFVIVGNHYDPSGNIIRGAYNRGHGDTYISDQRFASTYQLVNSMVHEAGHAMGTFHDDQAPFAQDLADGCDFYGTY